MPEIEFRMHGESDGTADIITGDDSLSHGIVLVGIVVAPIYSFEHTAGAGSTVGYCVNISPDP
jgi:hypothetical protein